MTDAMCRPIALMLAGGHVRGFVAGEKLILQMPDALLLNGDKG